MKTHLYHTSCGGADAPVSVAFSVTERCSCVSSLSPVGIVGTTSLPPGFAFRFRRFTCLNLSFSGCPWDGTRNIAVVQMREEMAEGEEGLRNRERTEAVDRVYDDTHSAIPEKTSTVGSAWRGVPRSSGK